jgi:ATP-dependent Clp protease protease subunit
MSVPYVIEDGGTSKERVYDLYSRLLKDRIIFIGQEFVHALANSVVAQLLFLEADDSESDVIIYINSQGGLVTSCMAIYDVMNYIKPEVSTVCVGQAASAAAFILAAGAKGKRYALKNAEIMLHQVSAGGEGNIEDLKIMIKETERANDRMMLEISKIAGKSIGQVKKDLDRDCYMNSEEAKEYGLIDEILVSRE